MSRIAQATIYGVSRLPGGSLPTSCYPDHRLDVAAVLDYADAAADAQAWAAWLARATARFTDTATA